MIQARSVSHLPHAILLPGQSTNAAMLPAYPHRSVSCLQRRGQPVANAAQGYRLGLPSTAHALPADAARNEKCQFSRPYT